MRWLKTALPSALPPSIWTSFALEEPRGCEADRRAQRPRQTAQGGRGARHGPVRRAAFPRSADSRGSARLDFKQCIIAAGSESVRLPGPAGRSAGHRFDRCAGTAPRLQADAGDRRRHHRLEMACVYDALGTSVSVVELSDGLMPAPDRTWSGPCRSASKNATSASCSTPRSRPWSRAPADCTRPSRPQFTPAAGIRTGFSSPWRSANGNAID